jgi:hypothetical protein
MAIRAPSSAVPLLHLVDDGPPRAAALSGSVLVADCRVRLFGAPLTVAILVVDWALDQTRDTALTVSRSNRSPLCTSRGCLVFRG